MTAQPDADGVYHDPATGVSFRQCRDGVHLDPQTGLSFRRCRDGWECRYPHARWGSVDTAATAAALSLFGPTPPITAVLDNGTVWTRDDEGNWITAVTNEVIYVHDDDLTAPLETVARLQGHRLPGVDT